MTGPAASGLLRKMMRTASQPHVIGMKSERLHNRHSPANKFSPYKEMTKARGPAAKSRIEQHEHA